MKVYVVAWEYGIDDEINGGGFDWYDSEKQADKAYIIEQANETAFTDDRENWTAYRFTQEIPDSMKLDDITAYIDSVFVDTIDKINNLKE